MAQAPNSPHAKRAANIYTRLRHNLVTNIYKSWEETGFAWEQYNAEDGRGQRTQHFTGWTSLVVKVMSMPEKPHLATVPVKADPKADVKMEKEVKKEKGKTGPPEESVLHMVEEAVVEGAEAVEQFIDVFAGGDIEDHDEL